MDMKKRKKVGAVICEYNPLHQGHRFQIREIRRILGDEGVILSLMSGDFVQRGEPAVYDKYDRARMALSAGVDLILELPYPWSASVAEHFASGAVSILKDLGVVDSLFFGSEEKNGKELALYAERCASAEYRKTLAQLRKEEKRLSFPKLNDLCYKRLYGKEPELCANEILGTQYISEIHRQKASFSYQALKMLPGISASVIREELLKQNSCASMERGERAVLTVLRLSEGKNRFAKKSGGCADLKELFESVRTPADTDARLKRELLSVILQTPDEIFKENPLFTVLLGANEKGRRLLSDIRKNKKLQVVTKQAQTWPSGDLREQYALYLKAQVLYASFCQEKKAGNALLKKRPILLCGSKS